jgi:hypothetical protein
MEYQILKPVPEYQPQPSWFEPGCLRHTQDEQEPGQELVRATGVVYGEKPSGFTNSST